MAGNGVMCELSEDLSSRTCEKMAPFEKWRIKKGIMLNRNSLHGVKSKRWVCTFGPAFILNSSLGPDLNSACSVMCWGGAWPLYITYVVPEVQGQSIWRPLSFRKMRICQESIVQRHRLWFGVAETWRRGGSSGNNIALRRISIGAAV